MSLVIEKGIPMPDRKYRGGRPRTNAAWQMEVGDSVVVEGKITASVLLNAFRRRGKKASQRKQEDGTFRVWRIA